MREELHFYQQENVMNFVHRFAWNKNAIIQAGPNAEGMDMYLYGEDAKTGIPVTAPVPCFLCCKLIINAE